MVGLPGWLGPAFQPGQLAQPTPRCVARVETSSWAGSRASVVWPKGSPRAWLSPWVTELIRMASGGDLSSAVGATKEQAGCPLENHLTWKSLPRKPLS